MHSFANQHPRYCRKHTYDIELSQNVHLILGSLGSLELDSIKIKSFITLDTTTDTAKNTSDIELSQVSIESNRFVQALSICMGPRN